MRLWAKEIEIRGCEQKASRKEGASDYLVVRFEDEYGKAEEAVDRDLERKPFYKRGTEGDLCFELKRGKDWCRLEVCDFKAKQQRGRVKSQEADVEV